MDNPTAKLDHLCELESKHNKSRMGRIEIEVLRKQVQLS